MLPMQTRTTSPAVAISVSKAMVLPVNIHGCLARRFAEHQLVLTISINVGRNCGRKSVNCCGLDHHRCTSLGARQCTCLCQRRLSLVCRRSERRMPSHQSSHQTGHDKTMTMLQRRLDDNGSQQFTKRVAAKRLKSSKSVMTPSTTFTSTTNAAGHRKML